MTDSYSRKFSRPTFTVLLLSVLLINLNFPSSLRLPLFIIICAIGFGSVYSTFTVFGASIIIPDIGLGPFTATQLAIVVWFGSWLILQRDHKFYYSKISAILIFLMLAWSSITALVHFDITMLVEILKVMGVALIGYHMLSLPNVRPELCLLSIVLALGLAALPYYFVNVFHLPGFENARLRGDLITNYFSYRSGEVRYSIAKQDPNAVSVLLSVALWGSLNLARNTRTLSLPKKYRWLTLYGFLMLPPLIAAESRAGYIVFIFGFLLTLAFGMWRKKRNLNSVLPKSTKMEKSNQGSPITSIAITTCVLLLFAVVSFQGDLRIFKRIDAIIFTLQEQGGSDRAELSSFAWNTIINDSPIFGVGTKKYLKEYSEGFAVHNTFLDMGVAAGLPGMIIMIVVIFFPLVGCMYRNRRTGNWMGITIVCYLLILPFLFSLSIIGDKLFWTFWTLLIFTYEHSFRSRPHTQFTFSQYSTS